MNKRLSVGILGGGQLGMMLCNASKKLNIETHIFCPDNNSPARLSSDFFTCKDYLDENEINNFDKKVDIITFEFENIPKRTLEIINPKKIRPGIKSLEHSQDRLFERKLLEKLKIPCAPYSELRNKREFTHSKSKFIESIIKTRRFGYDGKGQISINKNTEFDENISILLNEAIIEKKIPFDIEFSLVSCRDTFGNIIHFPLTENIHENHILKHSYAPLELSQELEDQAKEINSKILCELDHIGILTVEFFKIKKSIIVNEIAPRVHNSGHWTIEGCSSSQFDLHMQAITGERIIQPKIISNCHMVNLIGDDIKEWINKKSSDKINIHLYKKNEIKKDRKMGHVTYLIDNK